MHLMLSVIHFTLVQKVLQLDIISDTFCTFVGSVAVEQQHFLQRCKMDH